MNKKNVARLVAGLAVMGVVWAGVSGVQSFSSRESGRLGQRYDAIEEKIDKMDKLISSYYLNPEDIDLDKLEQGIYAGYVAGLEEDYTCLLYTSREFSETNDTLYASAWKSQFFSGMMQPIMNFVGHLGYVSVAVVGGYLTIRGSIEIGDIQAFIQYVRQFTQPRRCV